MSEGEIGGLSVKELCESLPEVRGDEISGCQNYFCNQIKIKLFYYEKEKGMKFLILYHLIKCK